MNWKIVATIATVWGLTACATAIPPHTVDIRDVRAFRLERLDVIVSPTAAIHWTAAVDEWNKSRSNPGSGKSETDELRAYLAAGMRARARSAMEPSLTAVFSGTRPVVVRVTVNHVQVPTFLEGLGPGVILGPHAVQSSMTASADVVDARTGAIILSFPNLRATTQGGYKLNIGTSGSFSHDPIERLMAAYGAQFASWLLKT